MSAHDVYDLWDDGVNDCEQDCRCSVCVNAGPDPDDVDDHQRDDVRARIESGT